jgi:hypothetical protein
LLYCFVLLFLTFLRRPRYNALILPLAVRKCRQFNQGMINILVPQEFIGIKLTGH